MVAVRRAIGPITGSHGSGNTVVSPMGIVNGKAVTLDLSISETAERNFTKIGTGNYVAAKFMCAKFHKNRAAGFFPSAYPTCSSSDGIFLVFFGFISQGIAQTAEPILTFNTSKEPVWA